MGKTTSPFTGFSPQQQQPEKPPESTFWTMCPYCNVKYQYYRDVVNKVLWCQRCKKSFTGHEIKDEAPTDHTPWSVCPYCTVKYRYYKSIEDNDDLESSFKKAKSSGLFGSNVDPVLEKGAPKTNKLEGSSMPMEEEDLNEVIPKETEKGKDYLTAAENGGKRSSEGNGETSPNSSPNEAAVPKYYYYPGPDFNDFDIDRREDCFVMGQIWAVYDILDGMPRFYARINRIISTSEFKLRITWLDADPDGEDESKWVGAGLPVSCGNLSKGSTETTDNHLMFSHLVDWEKGSKRDAYKIYPRKGQTWALFRNWDMNWHSDPQSKRKYEFEFVEILSDYREDDGVAVAYLGKLKGFSCLFYRTARGRMDSFQIPPSQLFRFSHRVPSFRLSGEERHDVPKNSFELDPASLPSKLEETDIPKDSKVEVETVVISEGEFFNFDGEKSPEKFEPGQFWALYSYEDGLPKYYAFIEKIDHQPEFELHVTWLFACRTKNIIKYADRRMPIGCGMFKLSEGGTASYTDTTVFSHRIREEPTDNKHKFAIYPRKGEVWAVYKNWNSRMTPSDLGKCDYDIVEVLEKGDISLKVVVLEMVRGYNSVFKARRNNESLVLIRIAVSELLKFSHQIPAFRLTGERGGSLRGCWELDPNALPVQMVH